MPGKAVFAALTAALLGGCASVPLADQAETTKAKLFNAPGAGMSGLYVYRDSSFGGAL